MPRAIRVPIVKVHDDALGEDVYRPDVPPGVHFQVIALPSKTGAEDKDRGAPDVTHCLVEIFDADDDAPVLIPNAVADVDVSDADKEKWRAANPRLRLAPVEIGEIAR